MPGRTLRTRMSFMALKIIVQEKRIGEFLISPIGPIDLSTCGDFEKRVDSILSSAPKAIILSMAKVTYITSMGLGLIIKIEKAMKERNGSFLVINLPAPIKKAFDIVAALPAMKIFANIEEADAYLLRMQQEETKKGE